MAMILFIFGFSLLMFFLSIPFFAMYAEDAEFHKNLKKREEFAKSIDKFVISIEYVPEKKPEPSPCQEPKWVASSPSSPTGTAIASPLKDGSCNGAAWSLPRADAYGSTPPACPPPELPHTP